MSDPITNIMLAKTYLTKKRRLDALEAEVKEMKALLNSNLLPGEAIEVEDGVFVKRQEVEGIDVSNAKEVLTPAQYNACIETKVSVTKVRALDKLVGNILKLFKRDLSYSIVIK